MQPPLPDALSHRLLGLSSSTWDRLGILWVSCCTTVSLPAWSQMWYCCPFGLLWRPQPLYVGQLVRRSSRHHVYHEDDIYNADGTDLWVEMRASFIVVEVVFIIVFYDTRYIFWQSYFVILSAHLFSWLPFCPSQRKIPPPQPWRRLWSTTNREE